MRVELNVGGTTFVTTRSTIQACGPVLYKMCAMNDIVFLDRDAHVFQHVLTFARSRVVSRTADIELLRAEAEYLCFDALIEQINTIRETHSSEAGRIASALESIGSSIVRLEARI